MYKAYYVLISCILCIQLYAQEESVYEVDTIIKYAVSNDTKEYCQERNYETEDCQKYLTKTADILKYQDNLNYFKIYNEQDELLLEYLAYGYFNKKYCGNYIRYYNNGIVKIKGFYACKTYKNYKKCNLKEGEWEYFNDAGQLIKVETYDLGKLVSIKHI